ncbi:PAS domain-containing protein [Hyphococcus sp.]|uniref:sensor histidine kinase n=1 Tax=Hyphococcus sp. TaxID=2038636 RepID=UPI003CCBD3B2
MRFLYASHEERKQASNDGLVAPAAVQTKNPIRLSQIRVLCVGSIFFACAVFIHIAHTFVETPGLTGAKFAGISAGILFLACSALAASTKRVLSAACLFLLTLTAAVMYASFKNGGLTAHTTPFLLLVPIAAGLFLGARASLYGFAAAASGFVVLTVADGYGWTSPSPYTPKQTETVFLSVLLMIALATTATIFIFARSNMRVLSELDLLNKNLMRSKAALKRANDEQSLVLDNTPVRIWFKDENNIILRANKAAAAAMGLDATSAFDANTYDIFPEMAEKYHDNDLEVIRSGNPKLGIIETFVTPEGKRQTVRTDKVPYTDPKTGKKYVFVASVDVTKEKTAEEALRVSEERLRLILDTSYDGYWDWRLQEKYEYMSPRFWEMFGYDPSTKRHHPDEWQSIIFEDDLKLALENFDRHVETRGEHPYAQEVRYRHADGSTVTVLCRGKVIEWDLEGRPLRMVGTHTDVSALKDAERAVRMSEERFALAAEGASVGIWDWKSIAEDGEYWSPRQYQLLGYSPDEIDPSMSSFKSLLHPEDVERTIKAVGEHFAQRTPFHIEYRLRHKTKGYRWFLGTGKAVWDDKGDPVRMIGTIMDIDDRKKAEAALEKRSEELRRSNQQLEEFAHIASHDLKAPLRGVDMIASWLEQDLRETLCDESRSNLTMMRSRITRMERLLDDLLAYAKAGQESQKLVNVDCANLVEDVFSLVAPAAFTLTQNSRLPKFVTAAPPFEQIFRNLIHNAVKHHDRDEGCISIRHEERDTHFLFEVSDDGPGVPAEYQRRIFGMYQTLKSRDKVEGSGMGLAIVKKIIEHAGGTIHVVSNPETMRGTTFSFTWPKQWPAGSTQSDALSIAS